jgi:hypothetical protein
MAPLIGIAPNFGALAATHIAFEFMDRRCLRSPHDVEGNGLMRVAAKAFHFEMAIAFIDSSPSVGDGLCRTLKAQHTVVPSLAGEPVGYRACLSQRSAVARNDPP